MIALIQDGVHHLVEIILDNKYAGSCKELLVEMFSAAYSSLKFFCYENRKNQMVLFNYLNVLSQHLQYDMGQIPLICGIFHYNKELLMKIDKQLLDTFVLLIENEGRQELFLDFFIVSLIEILVF